MSKSKSGGMLLAGGKRDLSGEFSFIGISLFEQLWKDKIYNEGKNWNMQTTLKIARKMLIWEPKFRKNESQSLSYNWGNFKLELQKLNDIYDWSTNCGHFTLLSKFKFLAGKWDIHNLGSIANFIEFLKSLHLNTYDFHFSHLKLEF